ncbi:MAG: hypothetical protein LBR05_01530 [Azoarcus sp.]|nr:hypothetical protein [Azoarcus sp.]
MFRPLLFSSLIASAVVIFCGAIFWAAKWPASYHRVAAGIGSAQSQYLIGVDLIREGKTTPARFFEGVEYVQRASEQGHVKAARVLADLALENGEIDRALGLYQEASRRGDSDAVMALSNIFSSFASPPYPGVAKDDERAERYAGFIKRFYFGGECWPVDNFDEIFPLPPFSLPSREEQDRLRKEGCRPRAGWFGFP